MFMKGQIKLEVCIFVLVTFVLYSLSSRTMENKGKVDFESREQGMGTPPTHLSAPPPYSELLCAYFKHFNPDQRYFVSSDDAATPKFSTNNAK